MAGLTGSAIDPGPPSGGPGRSSIPIAGPPRLGSAARSTLIAVASTVVVFGFLGWIVVNAAERTPERIMDAIRRGNFYASCGPQFHAIRFDGAQVEIETSTVQFIRLVGPAYRGQRLGSFDGQRLTAARFDLPADWDYAYLEIEDEQGRRAWTNTLSTS